MSKHSRYGTDVALSLHCEVVLYARQLLKELTVKWTFKGILQFAQRLQRCFIFFGVTFITREGWIYNSGKEQQLKYDLPARGSADIEQ